MPAKSVATPTIASVYNRLRHERDINLRCSHPDDGALAFGPFSRGCGTRSSTRMARAHPIADPARGRGGDWPAGPGLPAPRSVAPTKAPSRRAPTPPFCGVSAVPRVLRCRRSCFETVDWFNGGLFDGRTKRWLEKSDIETVLALDLDR